MDLIIIIFSGALLLFGIFIVGSNYLRQYINFKNQDIEGAPHSSSAPFVGPIFIIVG